MKKFLGQFFSGEHGASPWIAVFAMTVLLGFTAMAVDLGAVYLQTSKLQSALDAGVLAGASHLPDTTAATAAAVDCVQQNGFSSSDFVISFSDSDSRITLSSSKEFETMFLKALGINQWDINRKAAAAKTSSGGGGGVFDYRLFYGGTDTFSMGGSFNVYGSVHSNGKYSAYPSKGTITGTLEVVQKTNSPTFVDSWNVTFGKIVYPTPYIEMPDFTDVINNIMPGMTNYKRVSPSSIKNEKTWTGDMYVTGTVQTDKCPTVYGNVYIAGDLILQGGDPVFTLYGNLYVTGKIQFGNASKIYGSLMAEGNITFTGSKSYVDASSPICIYSKLGDINLTMGNITANGIVYAPNGTVKFEGSNLTFNGSIVAKKITGMVTGLTVGEPTMSFPFLPQGDGGVKLVE